MRFKTTLLDFFNPIPSLPLLFLTANYDRSIIFKEPIPNKVMCGHMISSSEVPNEGSCRVNCYLDPNCVSINMGPLEGGKLMCELNDVTSSQKESFIKYKKAHTYLEIQVKHLNVGR